MSSPCFCDLVTVEQKKSAQQQQFLSLTQRSCVIGVWVRGAVRGCGLANRQWTGRPTAGVSTFSFLFSFFILRLCGGGGGSRFSSLVCCLDAIKHTDERRTIAHSFFLHLIFHCHSQLPAVERLGCFDSMFPDNLTPARPESRHGWGSDSLFVSKHALFTKKRRASFKAMFCTFFPLCPTTPR